MLAANWYRLDLFDLYIFFKINYGVSQVKSQRYIDSAITIFIYGKF